MEIEKIEMVEDVWEIVNRLFSSEAPVMKSQYLDSIRSSKLFLPEVQLWLDVFKVICLDWLEYKKNPTTANYKLIRDLEPWMYTATAYNFPLERIAESIYLAFQMDMDLFKRKFRMWLRSNRPEKAPVKEAFAVEEPFVVETEEVECFYLKLDLS